MKKKVFTQRGKNALKYYFKYLSHPRLFNENLQVIQMTKKKVSFSLSPQIVLKLRKRKEKIGIPSSVSVEFALGDYFKNLEKERGKA